MSYLPMSQLPMTEEQQANGDVAQVFNDIQREMEIPFVPNIFKALAGSPFALTGTWDLMRNVYLESSLPMSLKAMILYAISAAHKCQYCSAVHQVTCKTVGVNEETLAALGRDLGALNPERVKKIVNFAVKCADDAVNLTEADYNQIRDQGIRDEELMEIIALAALGNYLDTLADALKIEVDAVFTQTLGG